MAIFDFPIVPDDLADAYNAHIDGLLGLGPKVPCPERRSKIVKIVASSMREAALLAERTHPNCVALSRQIVKSRNA
jgi:hypothetical protein